jgi:hypothetical protein
MRGQPLPPNPAALIEALRDIGYSLEAAVADIIDNSITAQARSIHIRFGWRENEPWVAFLDDGHGMSEVDLVEAMRPGSRNPRAARSRDDLGRFGLGLKTASFSQSRRLTVVSKQDGQVAARRWDLDEVNRTNDWTLLPVEPAEISTLPAIAELGAAGTYVLWDRLDRLHEGSGDRAHSALNERLQSIRSHLSLVFHRFMAHEVGFTRVSIAINGNQLEPFEPFNVQNPATQHLPEERVRIDSEEVVIQPYVLPHHSKVSPEEYERNAGEDGYLKSQGFYVYRNRRLIRHGTWFRLCRQEELTKLARVKIEIPNSLDHLWTIDVRKSRASPPESVRVRMRQVVEQIRGSAKRPYTHRGKVIEDRSTDRVWLRQAHNDRISYEINKEHPLVQNLRADLDESTRTRFDGVLRMISSSLPIPALFTDIAGQPKQVEQAIPDLPLLADLVRMMVAANPQAPRDELSAVLKRVEPFAQWPHVLNDLVDAALKDNKHVA